MNKQELIEYMNKTPMEDHHLLGFSQLQKRHECPGSLVMEFNEKDSKASKICEDGDNLHKAMFSKAHRDSIEDVNDLLLLDKADKLLQDVINETAIVSFKHEETLCIYDKEGVKISHGTGDKIGISSHSGVYVSVEFKFGFNSVAVPQNNWQCAAEALAIFQNYKDAEEVYSYIINPRINQFDYFIFRKKDVLADKLTDLYNKCIESSMLNAGGHCDYCKAKYKCQALELSNQSLINIELTQDNAFDIYNKALLIEKMATQLKSVVKKYATDNDCKNISFVDIRGKASIKDIAKLRSIVSEAGLDVDVDKYTGVTNLGGLVSELTNKLSKEHGITKIDAKVKVEKTLPIVRGENYKRIKITT